MAGAWAEAADGLAASGVEVTAGRSVTATVRAGRASLPDVAAPLEPLGDLVNLARFGPAGATESTPRPPGPSATPSPPPGAGRAHPPSAPASTSPSGPGPRALVTTSRVPEPP